MPTATLLPVRQDPIATPRDTTLAACTPVFAGAPLAATVSRAEEAVKIVQDRRRQQELAAARERATKD